MQVLSVIRLGLTCIHEEIYGVNVRNRVRLICIGEEYMTLVKGLG